MKNNPADVRKTLIEMTQQLLAESGEHYKRDIQLNDSLQRHLGIDSLARAELFQRIEKKMQLTLPDHLLGEAETLEDIANYLDQASPSIKKSIGPTITSHGDISSVDPLHVKTLIELLLLYGKASPDKPHIYFQHEDGSEEIITYGHLLKSSLQVAASLKGLGLKEGETVAIMQPTNTGFFYTFFGTLLAGGIPVPIYPPFRMHMIEAYAKTEARILNNAEVRILVTFEQAEKLSHLLKTFVESLKHVVTVDELLNEQELSVPYLAREDHFAFIQYTSGSTSVPKGVLLTHANLLANIRAYGEAIGVTKEDVTVSWLPLYHDMGLIGMWLGSLYFGIPLVLMTPFSFLNHPEKWLWTIHYHRGTLSGAPNFAYELCVKKIDESLIEGLDLSSWRMAANGAEAIYPKTLEQFAKKFAPYGLKSTTLLPVYGLAESTVGLAIPPLNREFRVDYIDRKKFEEEQYALKTEDRKNAYAFAACGKPIKGHAIRIVDDEGRELPERYIGRLEFKGPSSMQGYYHNPEATEAIYHDGWLDSGDLAYLADGEVFITGRRKDLIIKAGRNLYPAEIEELVGLVKGVRLGSVISFATKDVVRGTDQLIVVAETREKNQKALKDLEATIKETIATHLDIVADHIVLVSPHMVPKTSSGKLQRSACKKMYLDGQLKKQPLPPWVQVVKLSLEGGSRKIVEGFKWLSRFVYSIYLYIMLAITVLPLYVVVRFSKPSFAKSLCQSFAKIIPIIALCPIRVRGKEKLKKVSPAIYAANHASYIDSIILLGIVPGDTRFVGKKELFKTPIIRTFMEKLDFLGVDRMDLSKGIEDTKYIQDVLEAGHSILIFPEGTFGYASGLRPFRLGAFKIASVAEIPVYPIALQGTRKVLRDDEKLAYPNVITVTICDPIMPSGSEWQDVTQLRQTVRSEIAKYCGEPSLDFIAAQTVAPKI
jgi:1-acyl-sn-glycerol-3-phosphate acyltransferase